MPITSYSLAKVYYTSWLSLAAVRDFKEACCVTIAYPPPAAQRSKSSYSRWTSQKPTSARDIIKLQYTKHEVHTVSCNAAVVECRLKSELRLIRSSSVASRRRRLLSAKYWARLLKKVLGQYQYQPIPASIGQYPILQYRYRSNTTQNDDKCIYLFQSLSRIVVWTVVRCWRHVSHSVNTVVVTLAKDSSVTSVDRSSPPTAASVRLLILLCITSYAKRNVCFNIVL